jgi:hypothetical protein
MFTPYSLQGGTATLDPQLAGMNGQSRIPDLVGTSFPTTLSGVPVTNFPVGAATTVPTMYSPLGIGTMQPFAFPTAFSPYANLALNPMAAAIGNPIAGAIANPTAFASTVSPVAAAQTAAIYGSIPPVGLSQPFVNPYTFTSAFNPATVFGIPAIHPTAGLLSGLNPYLASAVNPLVGNPYLTQQILAQRSLLGAYSPFASQVPFGVPITGNPLVDASIASWTNPYACSPFGINPYLSPSGISPFGTTPYGSSILDGRSIYNPLAYGVNPLTATHPFVNPACTTPWGAGIDFRFPHAGSILGWNQFSAFNPISRIFNPFAGNFPSFGHPAFSTSPIHAAYAASVNPMALSAFSSMVDPFTASRFSPVLHPWAAHPFIQPFGTVNPWVSPYNVVNPIASAFNPMFAASNLLTGSPFTSPVGTWPVTGIPSGINPVSCVPTACCV